MRIVAKVGGACLEEPEARAELARSVRAAQHAGHHLVVVHGGGRQMRDWSQRLGLEERYHQGLRITDAATAEVALAVLGGLVNRLVVHALEHEGVRAVGLTGADGSIFDVARHAPEGRDLGFVGELHATDTALLELLLEARFVPVVATVAPLSAHAAGDRSRFYNVNADMAAGPLARALEADALLFLSDVPGVRGGDGRLIERLAASDCERLRRMSALDGGMLPKVAAALGALRGGSPRIVKVALAAGDNAVLDALEEASGTTFVREGGDG